MINKSWKKAPLSELLELNESGTWGDEGDSNDFPVLRSSNIHEGRLVLDDVAYRKISEKIAERYKLEDGDILVTKSSGSSHLIGKSCLFLNPDNKIYLFSNFTQRLRTKKETFDSQFLYYFLNSPIAKTTLKKISNTTSGLRNLSMKDYARQLIPLPPLFIQQQIAAILEKADAARGKRRQANQLTEQFLQSAFLEMFGDPATNPKGWEIKQLAELAHEIHPGSTPKEELNAFADEGIIFLRSENILNKKVKISENQRYIKVQLYDDFPRLQVKNEDVLINIIGASIGRCAVFDGNLGRALLNQNICLIRCNNNLFPNYLCNYFLTDYCQGFFKGTGRGGAQYALNAKILADLKVPYPSLSEQQKFAALVEKVESLRARQRQSEQELEHLFHSLMQRAFRGELVRE